MIKILIPNNNISERKYIIDILLFEFLGLKYNIEIKDIKNYEIILENGNKLIIEDCFFNRFQKELKYLNEENIPTKIEFIKNKFIVEEDIPVIYGNDKMIVKENQIICGIDIFASSFFMLTRWEEYVNKTRDKHNRFPSYVSLAYKFNFLDRPIVNEYIEMFWNMLKFLKCKQIRKNRNFQLYLTHDVDRPLKIYDFKSFLIQSFNDIKKGNLNIKNFEFLIFKHKDSFNTFDYFMDLSEKLRVKSYFFFMAGGSSKFDNRYKINDIFIQNLISKIKKRGHIIGIHPSYNAYNDLNMFRKEKELLEKYCNCNVKIGREHYLRFEIPTTWQVWEDFNMKWDSTLSYADKEGFRCGVCYEYSVYNILTREKLNLKEKPLIVMEGSFLYQQNISYEYFFDRIVFLINKVKKYEGDFIFLWHNSSFNEGIWKKYGSIYEKVLNYIQKEIL